MKYRLAVLGIVLAVLAAFGGCVAMFSKQTPGQEARDRCTKDYIAKNQLTPDAVTICEGIKKAVDAGVLKP